MSGTCSGTTRPSWGASRAEVPLQLTLTGCTALHSVGFVT